jgi:hypothetical protein
MAALIRGAGDGASPGPAVDGLIHGGDDETAVFAMYLLRAMYSVLHKQWSIASVPGLGAGLESNGEGPRKLVAVSDWLGGSASVIPS